MSHVTFAEMPYERPDMQAVEAQVAALAERLASAEAYDEARAAYLEHEALVADVTTQTYLATIRHSIDTRDAFYEAEVDFWNEAGPELQASEDAWKRVKLASAWRPQLEDEFGPLDFVNDDSRHAPFPRESSPSSRRRTA